MHYWGGSLLGRGELVPEAEVMRLLIQLCLAVELAICTGGTVHLVHFRRDMYPMIPTVSTMNVFLSRDGIVKLGNFGIARTLDHTLDAAQTQIGTPLYMSPEICNGEDYNTKSDIWSLGCVLYELVALTSPFQARTMHLVVTNVLQADPPPIPSHYQKTCNGWCGNCFRNLL
ncbi:hypothetical protein AaE_015034, partial [Aphanomyces astaci]